MAVFLFAFVFNVWGVLTTSTDSVVNSVIEKYPAAIAGLMSGDRIKSLDALKVAAWNDLTSKLRDKADKQISFEIERGVSSFYVNMVVVKNPVTGMGAIEVTPVKTKIGFIKSVYSLNYAISSFNLNSKKTIILRDLT